MATADHGPSCVVVLDIDAGTTCGKPVAQTRGGFPMCAECAEMFDPKAASNG